MADTYNIGPTVPALFAAHEARYKEAGKEIERLRLENKALRHKLQDAITRMDRARDILTDGRRHEWAMLDTNALRGEGEK
jgi:hypothetical protein